MVESGGFGACSIFLRFGTMTANHFQIQLGRQLGFIERSCRDFDAGHKDEAIRIATSLRVLFHDTNNATSLLTHLKAKQIKLLATIADVDSNPIYQLTVGFTGTVGKDDWSCNATSGSGSIATVYSVSRLVEQRGLIQAHWRLCDHSTSTGVLCGEPGWRSTRRS